MQVSQIPAKFTIPFANGAGGSFIRPVPAASQIGIQGGAASLTDGFPPLCFQPIASGGIPPWGQDFNGLLNQSTAWNRWYSAGGPVLYDATFQTSVGGYPNGAIVGSLIVQGNYWMSTVDNNVTNPDAGGAGWINPPSMMGTGHWQHRPVSDVLPGWIISNGTTIGSASSGATQRANADCAFAFAYLWNKFSNTQCPVSSGRGANAAADFAANKTIATFNMQAIGVTGVDGMGGTPTGLLNNVPAVSGSATVAGSVLGENLHALIAAEIPTITSSNASQSITVSLGGGLSMPAITGGWSTLSAPAAGGFQAPQYNGIQTIQNISSITSNNNISVTSNNTASGSHNNVQRSALVYWFMKL